MNRSANSLLVVLGITAAVAHTGCMSDVHSASPVAASEITRQASIGDSAVAGAKSDYDFCAAYPTGSDGCALCGHEDFSLDPGQQHVTVVDLSRCAGDVSFGHFSVVEYIRGGREVQSLNLRPGGGDYRLSVQDATSTAALPSALAVDPTYTYFANVPDPVVLQLTVRRDEASRGGKKSLALVYSSWLSR